MDSRFTNYFLTKNYVLSGTLDVNSLERSLISIFFEVIHEHEIEAYKDLERNQDDIIGLDYYCSEGKIEGLESLRRELQMLFERKTNKQFLEEVRKHNQTGRIIAGELDD